MAATDADPRPLSILLVEDEAAHAELVSRSLEGRSEEVEFIYVSDGEASMDVLQDCTAQQGVSPRELRTLVLLDLRLPRVDGLELVTQIKSSAALKHLPVVVLRTPGPERGVRNACYVHANGYFVKPEGFFRFSQLVGDISRYWLRWNHVYPVLRSSLDNG